MIPIGIFLISNLKSYNIPAVVQRKGTVRRLDLFSRLFLNEAKRQEERHRLLNANTLTILLGQHPNGPQAERNQS